MINESYGRGDQSYRGGEEILVEVTDVADSLATWSNSDIRG